MSDFIRNIDCLGKGYVDLVTWLPWNMAELYERATQGFGDEILDIGEMMGQDDLTVVNAAYASTAQEAGALDPRQRRLIAYLAEHGHTSPFRHAIVQLFIKAPLMVARQWFKSRVGSVHTPDSFEFLGMWDGEGNDGGFDDPLYAWNESSRRYVTSEPEFYVPAVWRSAPENRKQGSGGPVADLAQSIASTLLVDTQQEGEQRYREALGHGICAEQARLFLPAYGLYLYWRWTASLGAVCHFLNQRLADDAQAEIAEYARAVYALVSQDAVYPLSVAALVKERE